MKIHISGKTIDTGKQVYAFAAGTQKLYDYLTGIQWGRIEDEFGWVRKVR